jgi:hypothetical protein
MRAWASCRVFITDSRLPYLTARSAEEEDFESFRILAQTAGGFTSTANRERFMLSRLVVPEVR